MQLKRIVTWSVLPIAITLFCIYHSQQPSLKFSLKKITSLHSYNTRWDLGNPSKEQEKILDDVSSQLFRYLGCTKNSYEFLSENGIFLIKFFKQKKMKTQLFLNFFMLPHELKLMREEIIARRTLERNRLFSSYLIACERLPLQTNTLYLHLNPTKMLNRTLSIKAPFGKFYTLEMDKVEFLIQKQSDNILIHITNLMAEGQEKESKEALSAVLDLIIFCAVEGIDFLDKKQKPLFGFSNHKPIYCNIGNFQPSVSRHPTAQELYNATLELRVWLKRHYPQLANHMQNEIKNKTFK